MVAFLKPTEDDASAVLSTIAEKYRNEFSFGIVTGRPVAESEDVIIPAIVCYRSMDGDKVVTSDFDSAKLEEWVKESSRHVLGDLTPLNQQRLLDVRRLHLFG